MKDYRGKFTFAITSLDYSVFDGNIIFDELTGFEDVINQKVIAKFSLALATPPNIQVVFYYKDGTTNTIMMSYYSLPSTLPNYFGTSTPTGVGKVSSTMTNAYNLAHLQMYFDYTVNCYFLYKLNSEKNVVSKDITFVESGYMNYNNPISHKSMVLAMQRSASEPSFNYVYLTVLNRFYYVDSCVYTNDTMQMNLLEDVLMSFSDLIRSQTAYVERNENTYDADKVDELVMYDYDKTISYSEITPTLTLFSDLPTTEDNLILNNFIIVGIGGNN